MTQLHKRIFSCVTILGEKHSKLEDRRSFTRGHVLLQTGSPLFLKSY